MIIVAIWRLHNQYFDLEAMRPENRIEGSELEVMSRYRPKGIVMNYRRYSAQYTNCRRNTIKLLCGI